MNDSPLLQVDSSVESVSPDIALLFYGDAGIATVHSIRSFGTGAELTPGRFLENADLAKLASIFSGRAASTVDPILPECVLGVGPGFITWYRPGERRLMYFFVDGKAEALDVIWPSLIFHARGSNLSAVAFEDDSRPDASTAVYLPPLMNFYDSTVMCRGSARYPGQHHAGTIPQWENAVYGSNFTHINDSVKIAGREHSDVSHLEFWRHPARPPALSSYSPPPGKGRVHYFRRVARLHRREWRMSNPSVLPEYLTHRADQVVFGNSPMLMVPGKGVLPPCRAGQRRYLSAADGIWVEARTQAMHVRVRVAEVTLPFGPVDGFIRLSGGPVPESLTRRIVAQARARCPVEAALLVIWNARTGAYELLEPEQESASAGHITYQSWSDRDDFHLALDIHTHGDGPAFFSRTDDASDRAVVEPHISVVLGHCGQPKISVSTRVCIGEHLVTLDRPESAFAGGLNG